MTTEGTPNILLEVLQDVPPAPDSLATIWRRMGDETLAPEEERLIERFLDLAGRIVLIREIRGEDNEHTVLT